MKSLCMLVSVFLLLSTSSTAQRLAFPGATGFGKGTRGAYAKYHATGNVADLPKILYVDNLNNDGAGSLRVALTASGPRIVVFRTGGTIILTSDIYISTPYLTVAGYTTPGGGILVRGSGIWVREKEIIIRNIRVRPGVSSTAKDGINITAWVSAGKNKITNVIIDHCSVSWTSDGAIDINGKNGGVENVTIQNCIVAEGFAGHSFMSNSGTGCRSLSSHKNFYANAEARMALRSGHEPINSTVINNVTYNFKSEAVKYNSKNRGDALYNYFKNGPLHPTQNKAIAVAYDAELYPGEENKASIYLLGNQRNGVATGAYQSNTGSLTKMATVPFYNSTVYGFTPETNMTTLVTSVLSSAGAFPRDKVDARIVNNYNNNTGSMPTSTTVLDYPTLAAGTYPAHNNGVHLAWLVKKGYAVDQTAAASKSLAYLLSPANGKTGYSIVEEFINDATLYSSTSTTTSQTRDGIDTSKAISPGAAEICANKIDDDGDGQVDENCPVAVAKTWYRDADADGFGTSAVKMESTTQPGGYVAKSGDCDDTNKAVFPGATEICANKIDDDCDGQVDENCAAETPQISIDDVALNEVEGEAKIRVSLSAAYSSDVVIDYSTTGVTATSPQDFQTVRGHVIIPKGATTRYIVVPVVKDAVKEVTENFIVRIKSNSPLPIKKNKSIVDIYDGTALFKSGINQPTTAETNSISMRFFPNPSSSHFNLVVPSSKGPVVLQVQVVDVNGRVMENRVINNAAGTTITFGQNYPPGVYYIKATQNNEKATFKVIKL